MNKKKIGKIGEDFALEYFKNNGFEIREKNYKTKFGEVDLIVRKENLLIFVEVKARKSLEFGEPVEAVDKRKQEKIRFIANYYLSKKKIKSYEVRFDIFSILLDKDNKIKFFEHISNAF
ncbi:MAG: YraN family protein [Dictyoglomaceae bacterium]|nr:YraN family protein [Dictyoglomaceae bacterium]